MRTVFYSLGLAFWLLGLANGEVLKEARVSQVIHDVQLLQSTAAPRPATTSDVVRSGSAVRTGAESRAELTFTDLTIARMGANTIFSFNEGTRTVDLQNGAILLRVPKDSGGAKVRTAAVTAAITGTTVMVEYHKNAYAKFITLEGTMRVYLKGRFGESVLIEPGQMLIVKPDATRLPDPVDIDLERLVRTSQLTSPPFGPLGSEQLMASAQREQLGKKADGTLIDTNLVIFGRGTLVTLADPTSLDVRDRAPVTLDTRTATPTPTPTATPTATPSPTPVPTPAKYGTPSIITTYVPYPIDNGTVIQTDPAITRGGITDFGKIYRDAGQDGPFSTWAFGSNSSFDNQSLINAKAANMAVFKFADLQLGGNPSVSTANGGVPNLGLISVGPISSAPAGNITFTLPTGGNLLIATQNGAIDVAGINFSNLSQLTLYARGAGSNLTVNSALNVGTANFFGEGNVQTNVTGTVNRYAAVADANYASTGGQLSVGAIDIQSTGNLNFASRYFRSLGLVNGLTLNAGAIVNLDVSGDRSIFSSVNASPGIVVNGSTINVTGDPGLTTLPLGLAASFSAGTGGIQAPNIVFQESTQTASGSIGMTSTSDIYIGGLIGGAQVRAGGQITDAGVLNANFASAGTNITASDVQVLTLLAPRGVLTATGAGIHPYLQAGPGAQHQFTVGSIVAPGGIDFSGNYYVANGSAAPQNGGRLTINATTLTFDRTAIALTNFNGSDSTATSAGSGGVFVANTTGDQNVNSVITATTGRIANTGAFSGAGGSVTLNSSNGAINVAGTINVSSDTLRGATSPPPTVRESASGGNITLHSDLTSGTGINVAQSGQLTSLLNDKAPGPGGSILLSTKGADILVAGTVEADRGTITISQLDPVGIVSIADSAILSCEVLTITSAGNLQLGTTTGPAIGAPTFTMTAPQDITGFGFAATSTAVNSPGNYAITAGGNINLTGDLVLNHSNGAQTNGVNTNISAGPSLAIGGALIASTDASGLTSGGNIDIRSAGNISVTRGITLDTTVARATGSGANITLTSGGPVTANITAGATISAPLTSGGNVTVNTGGSVTPGAGEPQQSLAVDNAGGQIGTGGNLAFNSSGSLQMGTTGAFNLFINNRASAIGTGGNISSAIGGNFSSGGLFVEIDNSRGGAITSGGNISFAVNGTVNVAGAAGFFVLNSLPGQRGGTIGSAITFDLRASSWTIGQSLNAYLENVDGIVGSSNDFTLNLRATNGFDVAGPMNVYGNVIAGTDINAATISITNATATGNINAGSGGITPFTFPEAYVPIPHVLTATRITSQNGINFNGPSNYNGFGPFDGGTLTLNVSSITFGAAGSRSDILGPVTLNGGDAQTAAGGLGNGGTLLVNAASGINVGVGETITATTGARDAAAAPFGTGGTVDLRTTSGRIAVNGTIQVSSADTNTTGARRRSNAGGRINVQSATSGAVGAAPTVAINITNTSQLLSLLNAAAKGPGGKITILATGTNSSISVNGATPGPSAAPSPSIVADRGTVDIRHTGDGGQISLNSAGIRADTIKVGALGANGVLSIGGGTITADTMLKLYAVGSNGTLNFVANCSIGGGTSTVLAANTINISNNVVVTINGKNPAQVFTNNANYSGSGGNGSTTGTFGGAGAQRPQPLSSAPAFDGP